MVEPSLYNSNALRLGKGRKLFFHALWLGLIASGVVWLVLHAFVRVKGEFGPEPSPFEPMSLRVHGGLAFLALWFGGMMWGTHMLKGWNQKRRRWTGVTLLTVFGVLILTGYLLYYAGDEDLRGKISLVHWIVGLGIPAAYLLHRLSKKA